MVVQSTFSLVHPQFPSVHPQFPLNSSPVPFGSILLSSIPLLLGSGPVLLSSAPVLLRATNLVDDGAEEDEHVLEEDGNSWPLDLRLWNDITSKEDPTSSNKRAKAEHESEEEPYACPIGSNAAIGVHVAPHLPIANRIHHKQGESGNDSTHMVRMIEVCGAGVSGSCVDDKPPAQGKHSTRSNSSHKVPSLTSVPVLTYSWHVLCDCYTTLRHHYQDISPLTTLSGW